jgi:CheY-like chemotaxis protein
VVLMSGVVNRAVAEKAFAVHADELLRKPFQPQDLIARVKHLLKPNGAPAPSPAAAASAAVALSSIFSGASPMPPRSAAAAAPARAASAVASAPAPANAPALFPVSPGVSVPEPVAVPAPAQPRAITPSAPTSKVAVPASPSAASHDVTKFKVEVLRLEGLVKKLQAELQAEREYARALESHVKTLQEAEH